MVKLYVVVNTECQDVYDVYKNDDYVFGCYDALELVEQTNGFLAMNDVHKPVKTVDEAIDFWTKMGYFVYTYEQVYPQHQSLWDIKYIDKDNIAIIVDTFPKKEQAQAELKHYRNRGLLDDNQYFMEKRNG